MIINQPHLLTAPLVQTLSGEEHSSSTLVALLHDALIEAAVEPHSELEAHTISYIHSEVLDSEEDLELEAEDSEEAEEIETVESSEKDETAEPSLDAGEQSDLFHENDPFLPEIDAEDAKQLYALLKKLTGKVKSLGEQRAASATAQKPKNILQDAHDFAWAYLATKETNGKEEKAAFDQAWSLLLPAKSSQTTPLAQQISAALAIILSACLVQAECKRENVAISAASQLLLQGAQVATAILPWKLPVPAIGLPPLSANVLAGVTKHLDDIRLLLKNRAKRAELALDPIINQALWQLIDIFTIPAFGPAANSAMVTAEVAALNLLCPGKMHKETR